MKKNLYNEKYAKEIANYTKEELEDEIDRLFGENNGDAFDDSRLYTCRHKLTKFMEQEDGWYHWGGVTDVYVSDGYIARGTIGKGIHHRSVCVYEPSPYGGSDRVYGGVTPDELLSGSYSLQ